MDKKYERSGYLFQGRYRSEPVDSEEYLLTVLRYIHQNPVKIGRPLSYWTSYDEYIGDKIGLAVVDTTFILELLGSTSKQAIDEFKWLVEQQLDEGSVQLARSAPHHIGDAKAIELIKQLGNVTQCHQIAALTQEQKNDVFVALRRKGCSVRQIARLTGVNRGLVHRAWKAG